MMVSFLLPDDEFEEEPEDELASAGMHVTTDDDEVKANEDLDEDEVVVDDDDEDDEDDEEDDEDDEEDVAPNGLEELEELEKEVINESMTFGDVDDE